MELNTLSPEIRFAIESVSKAAELVKEIRAQMVEPALTKDDRSPVTIADFAAQALIGKFLLEQFPDDAFVAEEDPQTFTGPKSVETLERVGHFLSRFTGGVNPEKICEWIGHGQMNPTKRFWTLDPIDGTKGFLRGDQYAIALALVEDGKVQLGVLGCPNLKDSRVPDVGGAGTLSFAARSKGAWTASLSGERRWQPLHVSDRGHFDEAVILRSYEARHTDTSRTSQLMEKLGVRKPPLLMDSLAKYSVLASSEADLLLRFPTSEHPHECIWDQAAGVIIVEEAGGRVTDLEGKVLDFSQGRYLTANRGVVVSNGHLHDRTLEALKKHILNS